MPTSHCARFHPRSDGCWSPRPTGTAVACFSLLPDSSRRERFEQPTSLILCCSSICWRLGISRVVGLSWVSVYTTLFGMITAARSLGSAEDFQSCVHLEVVFTTLLHLRLQRSMETCASRSQK